MGDDTQEKVSSHPEAKGLLIIGACLALFLCLLTFQYGDHTRNWLGLIGYIIAFGLQYLFGLSSYLVIGFCTWMGWKWLSSNEPPKFLSKAIYFGIIVLCASMLFNLFAEITPPENPFIKSRVYSESVVLKYPYPHRYIRYYLGGAPLYYLYRDLPTFNLAHMLSNIGIFLTFSMILLVSLMLLTNTRLSHIGHFFAVTYRGTVDLFKRFYTSLKPLSIDAESEEFNYKSIEKSLAIPPRKAMPPPMTKPPTIKKKLALPESPKVPLSPVQTIQTGPTETVKPRALKSEKTIYDGDYNNYKLPPLTLLTPAKKIDMSTLKRDLKRQADILEETLLSFGVEAHVGRINCGPTIASFEVHPPTGVKVQKIKVLENDIALNMEASSIRIIAPIPGKAAVGVEVPSPKAQEVGFREMLQNYQKLKGYEIPIMVGKTVSGEDVYSDLAKMPHCLIAGATGAGKSVCINSIVLSILMNARPDEVKLLLIDPKKVELSGYSELPHMIAPVITEAQGAYAALNWLVKEMLHRYEILKQIGLRNISAFNKRKPKIKQEEALNIPIPKRMSYIVCIIDEFADLMMASSSDLETPIARIAQMARAVGIHLVLATQRPSREVITGLIKANFPTRIAFKVASRVNSQIILDDNGAETLLGNGDLLLLPPGTAQLTRAQGVFVRDKDINNVVEHICSQAPTQYLIKSFDQMGRQESDVAPKDDLYSEARAIVIETGSASTTYLQRKLKIGYARAASLMDELEDNGVIGPQEGSRPRQVLSQEWQDE
ncbi:MAG: DNA translocase FtsK [Chlamydiia bacterium]|nr:DNA translocase FtsK [Chlamydiia bacterium]MCH9616106.1 DNA translocase FtsK [Chlamydiia bacterium]MCH9629471.1 DNA translocase FtsK [Chlamydiia bacterium]